MKQHLQAALAALTEAQLHLERAETARQFSPSPTYTHLRSLQPALEDVRNATDRIGVQLGRLRLITLRQVESREQEGAAVRAMP